MAQDTCTRGGRGAAEGPPQALRDFFRRAPKLAVAFSGGADSAYLLHAAAACGACVRAYCVHSLFQPAFEREDALRFAKSEGVPLTIIELDILARAEAAENTADRCYHCKKHMLAAIARRAAQDGFTLLADGTNASDEAGERPGMRALAEMNVRSPLREAGITKALVRQLSREAGLFTWDKPAYACLATRIAQGERITAQALQNVESAEAALAGMGFRDFRVRTSGGAAKLQVTGAQLATAVEKRGEILRALSDNFTDITLDLRTRG